MCEDTWTGIGTLALDVVEKIMARRVVNPAGFIARPFAFPDRIGIDGRLLTGGSTQSLISTSAEHILYLCPINACGRWVRSLSFSEYDRRSNPAARHSAVRRN